MQLFKKKNKFNPISMSNLGLYITYLHFDFSKLIFHEEGNRELCPTISLIKCKVKVYWDFELK